MIQITAGSTYVTETSSSPCYLCQATPSKSAFFRDGKIAPNSSLDIGNASTTNKDIDPTINTDSTSNKHTKIPVSALPPSTYDRSPSDLTQTAISIGLSIGVWNETFLKDEQIIELPVIPGLVTTASQYLNEHAGTLEGEEF